MTEAASHSLRWHALVPIKQGADNKSRLASVLSRPQRAALSQWMAQHVLAELKRCSTSIEIAVLSETCPAWWDGSFVSDLGRGLNAELTEWRRALGPAPCVIIHADLPLLRATEVDQLLASAARQGVALATDRAGEGSNALAIADGRTFAFRFGLGSRKLHEAQVPGLKVLQRPGLATDIDTPDDLAFAEAFGSNCAALSGTAADRSPRPLPGNQPGLGEGDRRNRIPV